MDAMAEYREALRKMLDADDNDQSAAAESGFAVYIRWLVRSIDEVARDHDADQDVLDALGELREALPKMVAVAARANDVLPWAGRALGDFKTEIEELIDMIKAAAAGGEVDREVQSACKAIKAIEDFIRAVESWAAGEDEEEAVDEEEVFLGDQIQQEMYEEAFQVDELDVLATGEVEEEAVDGEVFLDGQAQQEMYEEDEVDYQEMMFSIDEGLDEFRQEVAGCSDEHPRTGFLGRYGFSTDQHFYQLIYDAL